MPLTGTENVSIAKCILYSNNATCFQAINRTQETLPDSVFTPEVALRFNSRHFFFLSLCSLQFHKAVFFCFFLQSASLWLYITVYLRESWEKNTIAHFEYHTQAITGHCWTVTVKCRSCVQVVLTGLHTRCQWNVNTSLKVLVANL